MNQALSTIIILIKLDSMWLMIWFVTSIQWGVLALALVGNVLAANVRGPQKFGIALVRHFAQLKKDLLAFSIFTFQELSNLSQKVFCGGKSRSEYVLLL